MAFKHCLISTRDFLTLGFLLREVTCSPIWEAIPTFKSKLTKNEVNHLNIGIFHPAIIFAMRDCMSQSFSGLFLNSGFEADFP